MRIVRAVIFVGASSLPLFACKLLQRDEADSGPAASATAAAVETATAPTATPVVTATPPGTPVPVLRTTIRLPDGGAAFVPIDAAVLRDAAPLFGGFDAASLALPTALPSTLPTTLPSNLPALPFDASGIQLPKFPPPPK